MSEATDFQLDTDTVSEVEVADSLDVDGETVHVIGKWEPPFLALPELDVVRGDGSADRLVVADDAVGFRSDVVDDEFPDDAQIPTDAVGRAGVTDTEWLDAITSSELPITDTRESPIHPDGRSGQFRGGARVDGMTVEVYRDSGETSDAGDYPDGYGDETTYVFVREFPEPDTAMLQTFGFRTLGVDAENAEYTEISGVYRRHESGRYGALCGANGPKGWYTATEVALFLNAKGPAQGERFGTCSTLGTRIEWSDDQHTAKIKFRPVEEPSN